MNYQLDDTSVTNSRYFKGQNTVWRRRKSPDGTVFTTRERIDLNILTIVDRENKKTKYLPAKLLQSFISTLDHRQDALEAAWALLITIENRMLESVEKGQIEASAIAKVVLEVLKAFDSAAYLAYARKHSGLVSKEEIIEAIGK